MQSSRSNNTIIDITFCLLTSSNQKNKRDLLQFNTTKSCQYFSCHCHLMQAVPGLRHPTEVSVWLGFIVISSKASNFTTTQCRVKDRAIIKWNKLENFKYTYETERSDVPHTTSTVDEIKGMTSFRFTSCCQNTPFKKVLLSQSHISVLASYNCLNKFTIDPALKKSGCKTLFLISWLSWFPLSYRRTEN